MSLLQVFLAHSLLQSPYKNVQKETKAVNNVNNLLEQCTDSSNGNQSRSLYHFTNITKLLQYNIDSLHDPKHLVAPKLLLFLFFFFFKSSSLLKKHVYQSGVFALISKKDEGRSSNQV